MRIEWVTQTRDRVPKIKVTKALQQTIQYLRQEGLWTTKSKELVVVTLTPLKIAAINAKFRGKKKPTDVLSFAGSEPKVLGELLLCPRVLRKQAKVVGHSYDLEFIYMVIHGVLHLIGYDHERSDKDAREMYRLQDVIFNRVRSLQNVRRNRTLRS